MSGSERPAGDGNRAPRPARRAFGLARPACFAALLRFLVLAAPAIAPVLPALVPVGLEAQQEAVRRAVRPDTTVPLPAPVAERQGADPAEGPRGPRRGVVAAVYGIGYLLSVLLLVVAGAGLALAIAGGVGVLLVSGFQWLRERRDTVEGTDVP